MSRRGVAAALAAVLMVTGMAGCGFGKKAATVITTLPDSPTTAPTGTTTRTVNLGVGQVLGVDVQYYDSPTNWEQVSAGNGKLLKGDGEDTLQGCDKNSVGCRPDLRERYKALAPGTTTIEWDWVSPGPAYGTRTPLAIRPCAKGDTIPQCPAYAAVKIVVTIK